MDYTTLVAEAEANRLSRVPLTVLYEALQQVKDGRKKRGCRYTLALMDWLGVPNVPDQMRIFAAFPQLALDLFLGPLTFE